MKYAIGGDKTSSLIACSESKMTIVMMKSPSGSLILPLFISFDDSIKAEASISIFSTNTTDVGTYRMNVREVDFESGLIRVTEITLEVYMAFDPDEKLRINLNAEPLIARVLSFTRTGNLTIAFNKPIIIPNIEVYNETERLLQDSLVI